MTLLILDRLKVFTELWTKTMPSQVAVPPDSTFIGWLGDYSDDEVQMAVLRTGKKMSKKLRDGLVIEETDAARYCSAVLRSNRRGYDRE